MPWAASQAASSPPEPDRVGTGGRAYRPSGANVAVKCRSWAGCFAIR